MGISEATYYLRKKRHANLGLLEVREPRQLRDENVRLKRLGRVHTIEVLRPRGRSTGTP